MSFLVDFCFIVFMPDIDTKDFVFILAILLPWRVIRVVNSKYRTENTVRYLLELMFCRMNIVNQHDRHV